MSGLGIFAAALVFVAFTRVGEESVLLYRGGGFLVISAAVCLLVVAATYRGTAFSAILEAQPLRWIGERSYGLYLWHWPIYMLTRPGLDLPLRLIPSLAIRLILTGIIAEISYRFVEKPIRDGAFGKFVAAWRQAEQGRRSSLLRRTAIWWMPASASLILSGVALATIPQINRDAQIPADIAEAMGLQNGGPTRVTISATSKPVLIYGPFNQAANSPSPSPDGVRIEPSEAVRQAVAAGGLTAIGDSVLLGARFYLERSIAGARTDAEVGRQAAAMLERIEALRSEGLLAPAVLLHFGTNGDVTEDQLRQALQMLSDRQRVIVVNSRVPRQWM
jgi:hypothetical protein